MPSPFMYNVKIPIHDKIQFEKLSTELVPRKNGLRWLFLPKAHVPIVKLSLNSKAVLSTPEYQYNQF